MTVLSDGEILELIEQKKLIDKFNPDQLTPNGYDLTIEKVEINGKIIEPNQFGLIPIPPLTHFLVLTVETVTIPRDLVASIWTKSKWTRRGIIANYGKFDAGYSGKPTFGMFNSTQNVIEFNFKEKGRDYCPIAQIVFEHLGSPALRDYSERSGTYQNTKDIKV